MFMITFMYLDIEVGDQNGKHVLPGMQMITLKTCITNRPILTSSTFDKILHLFYKKKNVSR